MKLTDAELDMIYEFVDDNLALPIGVADVAESSGLDYATLNRRFKETLGFSLTLYIMEQRVKSARRLLEGAAGRRRSLADVAEACGFTGPDQMRRHFKRLVGVTPSVYQDRAANR